MSSSALKMLNELSITTEDNIDASSLLKTIEEQVHQSTFSNFVNDLKNLSLRYNEKEKVITKEFFKTLLDDGSLSTLDDTTQTTLENVIDTFFENYQLSLFVNDNSNLFKVAPKKNSTLPTEIIRVAELEERTFTIHKDLEKVPGISSPTFRAFAKSDSSSDDENEDNDKQQDLNLSVQKGCEKELLPDDFGFTFDDFAKSTQAAYSDDESDSVLEASDEYESESDSDSDYDDEDQKASTNAEVQSYTNGAIPSFEDLGFDFDDNEDSHSPLWDELVDDSPQKTALSSPLDKKIRTRSCSSSDRLSISVSPFYTNGDLLNYANSLIDSIETDKLYRFFNQMANTLLSLKNADILFPDARNKNWLINAKFNLVVDDIKSHLRIAELYENPTEGVSSTPGYCPPELLKAQIVNGHQNTHPAEESNSEIIDKENIIGPAHAYTLGINLYEFINPNYLMMKRELEQNELNRIRLEKEKINKQLEENPDTEVDKSVLICNSFYDAKDFQFDGIPFFDTEIGQGIKGFILMLAKEKPEERLSLETAAKVLNILNDEEDLLLVGHLKAQDITLLESYLADKNQVKSHKSYSFDDDSVFRFLIHGGSNSPVTMTTEKAATSKDTTVVTPLPGYIGI